DGVQRIPCERVDPVRVRAARVSAARHGKSSGPAVPGKRWRMTDSFDPAHEAPLVSPWTPSLEQHADTARKALEKGRAAVTRYPSGIRADYFDASVYALDEIVALARE